MLWKDNKMEEYKRLVLARYNLKSDWEYMDWLLEGCLGDTLSVIVWALSLLPFFLLLFSLA
jgi:hypothetical protein